MSTYAQKPTSKRSQAKPTTRLLPKDPKQNRLHGCFAEQLQKNLLLKFYPPRYQLTIQMVDWYGQQFWSSFHRPSLPGTGGELPCTERGGVLRSQYQARYRRSTGPNHSLYQSGFPNNYFGLAAMNNPERAYLAIHFYCAIISVLIVTWKDSSLRWSLKQDKELCIKDVLMLVSGWDRHCKKR